MSDLDVLSSEVITYAPDLGTTYAETVTVKTTTLIFNTDGYGKDLLEDIDRVRYTYLFDYSSIDTMKKSSKKSVT